ncbi:MAG: tRNA (guanosine(37)-N1)-methyltransferase TrmD [Candidatus Pacebacteria bacterium]|nr:tRNA (guanosine(37)-N1)-methyltransferase TrmD [Candidatus Paceibacterota bacterium]MDD3072607.1 tRNA (guanosine(37)-N1)-methyltransferase TrmD [Candidatus Paceibacterota bacterium]MDD3728932.1 tRNA (guanosine(37)-N1)-methyltransferase TrmD [Candidatus Paceibacterota bacterium]MDD4201549.1 tRNA (guanosine(37)-N1)-methyltransferase TrmD [Candidatus Paceibacterota bacterium]MDD4897391.1 tRNA (guanosine(37)-N1)-methyltransferase TrmD [Candidatus Paceibacterota bacterium]
MKKKFDIITIFPEIFNFYFKESIISKGVEKGLLEINVHDLRSWSKDKHKKVDDKPFGGGLGMVMKIEPIYNAVKDLKKKKSKVVLFSPRGKKFTQKTANELSKMNQVILICGRYEGIDERVKKEIADMEISIGDYVLMGGEIPSMVVIEAVSRLIPGVIGKEQFLKERVDKNGGFIEYPQYTRPEVFSPKKGTNWKVPKVLLSGNHKKIEEWKKKKGRIIE